MLRMDRPGLGKKPAQSQSKKKKGLQGNTFYPRNSNVLSQCHKQMMHITISIFVFFTIELNEFKFNMLIELCMGIDVIWEGSILYFHSLNFRKYSLYHSEEKRRLNLKKPKLNMFKIKKQNDYISHLIIFHLIPKAK